MVQPVAAFTALIAARKEPEPGESLSPVFVTRTVLVALTVNAAVESILGAYPDSTAIALKFVLVETLIEP